MDHMTRTHGQRTTSVEAEIRKEYRRADKRAFAMAYLANVRAGRSSEWPASELGHMGKQCITWTVNRLLGEGYYPEARVTGEPCEEDELCAVQVVRDTGAFGR